MELASARVNSSIRDRSPHLLKPATGRTTLQTARAWAGLCAAAGVVASLALHYPSTDRQHHDAAAHRFVLTALSQDVAATVLTLEPGIVGIQHSYYFTPRALQGSFCAAPNTCRPVDYSTLPGDSFNEQGGATLVQAVNDLPADGGPVILMGYSQGAQVIYSALRRWQAKPSQAPDPSRVSWVSIGNPDNPIGGIRNSFGNAQPRPAETPYPGTEVIRQYDGWADWPDKPTNLLAVANALAGMAVVHSNYFDVNINDPANVRHTPALPDGRPGNVTYVWVPTPVLPLVAGLGPLGPMLDPLLRPTIEAAYTRPVQLPVAGAKSAATASPDMSITAMNVAPTEAASARHHAERRSARTADTAEPKRTERPKSAAAQRRGHGVAER